MEIINDIKKNWKDLAKIPVTLVLMVLTGVTLVVGTYNLLVWITPNECHEYISWQDVITVTTIALIISVTTTMSIYVSMILSYPLHWVSSKLPPMPKKIKRYLETRKRHAQEEEKRNLNKPPSWFARNEATIVLILFSLVIIAFIAMSAIAITRFYYCL